MLSAAAVLAQTPKEPAATFGTTVISNGFRGDVYLVSPRTQSMPKFNPKSASGSVYTTMLQITPRTFSEGFPGLTDRFEWFAIDYNARIWIEREGVYKFGLLSDDGSILWIDGKKVIDNDGIHIPLRIDGSAWLSRGVHTIRVAYFQGPRYNVALVLTVAGPNNDMWMTLNTDHFKPPPDPKEWVPGTIRDIKRGENW
ncbi:MAG: beta-glucosidase [Acidobacteria bacterium]|nr:beta-glucosidase [Acidobacteriota bacterium]